MAEETELTEYLFKILVVGDVETGKTSIIKRYVHSLFSQSYKSTIGVDFALKVLRWGENSVVRLQLWDIAGQERFGNMTRVYYKEAVGAFVVFDCTQPKSLESVKNWKSDIDAKVHLPGTDSTPIPVVLLSNKCDLQASGIAAEKDQMKRYCEEMGFAGWFETSAKEDVNIDKAARFLVSRIMESDTHKTREDASIFRPEIGDESGHSDACC